MIVGCLLWKLIAIGKLINIWNSQLKIKYIFALIYFYEKSHLIAFVSGSSGKWDFKKNSSKNSIFIWTTLLFIFEQLNCTSHDITQTYRIWWGSMISFYFLIPYFLKLSWVYNFLPVIGESFFRRHILVPPFPLLLITACWEVIIRNIFKQ